MAIIGLSFVVLLRMVPTRHRPRQDVPNPARRRSRAPTISRLSPCRSRLAASAAGRDVPSSTNVGAAACGVPAGHPPRQRLLRTTPHRPPSTAGGRYPFPPRFLAVSRLLAWRPSALAPPPSVGHGVQGGRPSSAPTGRSCACSGRPFDGDAPVQAAAARSIRAALAAGRRVADAAAAAAPLRDARDAVAVLCTMSSRRR